MSLKLNYKPYNLIFILEILINIKLPKCIRRAMLIIAGRIIPKMEPPNEPTPVLVHYSQIVSTLKIFTFNYLII